jgi:hypothetical protein
MIPVAGLDASVDEIPRGSTKDDSLALNRLPTSKIIIHEMTTFANSCMASCRGPPFDCLKQFDDSDIPDIYSSDSDESYESDVSADPETEQ